MFADVKSGTEETPASKTSIQVYQKKERLSYIGFFYFSKNPN